MIPGIHCSEGWRQGKENQQLGSNPGPTLYCGASATSYQSQPRILRPPSPFTLDAGVLLSSNRLGPTPQGWYCVMWWKLAQRATNVQREPVSPAEDANCLYLAMLVQEVLCEQV